MYHSPKHSNLIQAYLMPEELAEILRFPKYRVDKLLSTPKGNFIATKSIVVPVKIGRYESDVTFLLCTFKAIILGIECLPKFRLNINYDLKVIQSNFPDNINIVNSVNSIISGHNTGMISEEQIRKLSICLGKYKKVFSDHSYSVGEITTEQCCIRLQHEIPINLRPYKTTLDEQKLINSQIEELLSLDIIRPSTSPYSFPIVLVDKKDDGKKSRLCIDY